MSTTPRRLRSTGSEPSLFAEFASVATVGALVATLLLFRTGGRGWQLLGPGLLSLPAYVLAVQRRDWRLLAGVVGIAVGTAIGWLVHLLTGFPWALSWMALATVAAVWAPWPTPTTAPARALVWVTALAPLIMLVLAGPDGVDVGWIGDLFSGARLGLEVGINEVGIASAVAVVAVLALRTHRDTTARYVLQVAVLVIAGATGTRAAFPAIVVSAWLWWRGRHAIASWRGRVVEAMPWLLYLVAAIMPLLRRTLGQLDDGLDRVSAGRLSIWRQYADVAADAPWSGWGLGSVDALRNGILQTPQPPHNVPLELVVEIGVPGAVVALAGLAVLVAARARRVDGPHRWLFRVPLVVLLPTVALVDLPLKKPHLTLPALLFAAAIARLQAGGHTRARELSPASGAPSRSRPG